jgi:hypothetical protein
MVGNLFLQPRPEGPDSDFTRIVREMHDLKAENDRLRTVCRYAQLLAYLAPIRVVDTGTGQELSAEELYQLTCEVLGADLEQEEANDAP